MDVHQISIRYDADQDRVLVSVNTHTHEEILLWLTRRLLVGLWPLLNRIMVDHFALPPGAKTDGFVSLESMSAANRQHLAHFQRESALAETNFGVPYRRTALHRPMGQTPLLVSEVNLTPREGAHLQLHFKEQVQGSQRSFQMDLRAELLYGVIELLGQALQQSQWMPGSTTEPTVVVETRHAEPDEDERPRYLN